MHQLPGSPPKISIRMIDGNNYYDDYDAKIVQPKPQYDDEKIPTMTPIPDENALASREPFEAGSPLGLD